MGGMTGKMFWLPSLAILAVTVAGCGDTGGEGGIEVEAHALNPALQVSGLPQGLMCGTSYYGTNKIIEDEFCLGQRTVGTIPPPNFKFRSIGDRGLQAGGGFLSYASLGSGAATLANSDRLALLRGTTCGFKETCNNSTDLCMGLDPDVRCPRGWSTHSTRDYSSTACSFVWCSYDDPLQVCCNDTTCDPACLSNMPRGTTCGMGALGSGSEMCGTSFPPESCPTGFHRTKSFYDWGRPAGSGLFYCTKN